MSYGLRGKAGAFDINIWGWEFILKAASSYGWEPAGAMINEDFVRQEALALQEDPERVLAEYREEWAKLPVEETYLYNSWQVVADDDARDLGEAFERALNDIDNPALDMSESVEADCFRPFIDFAKAGQFLIL